MNERFYPFNPRTLRLRLALTGLTALGLAAWALRGFVRGGGGALDGARAGMALGLALTLSVLWTRLRPRAGWGVTLSALGVKVSRPLSRAPLELTWDDIQQVSRSGKMRDSLLLWGGPEVRVSVGRHLFASEADFEALAGAIEHRKPRPILDA